MSAVWAGLAALIVMFDAAWWLMALCTLPSLPLIWEIATDRQSGLEMDDTHLNWFSGRMSGTAKLAEIDWVRMDTRWDFSVRTTLCLRSGKRVRLPQECTPPHRAFEEVLTSRGLTVIRHHFARF
ncbi:hypothetical protein [Ruegeria aquimaris]|uniref:YcxB-like protein domain-containing protein n=1 Tax=Ruegeria aquimaris TaxID=2984333 RepID=A0ABT3AN72_9RHOB|nr:hypothetical protein [Ruegeria sp. XHP0148]MCV2890136.1 hypothetical protein [Ruegeria sp. XHP0148]